jgi:anti-anti-sigma regulatory factor
MDGSGGSDEKQRRPVPRELTIARTETPRGLCLAGDLSSENAYLLTAALAALAADGGAPGDLTLDLTLDLTDLSFVDTIGLHVIARAAAELVGRGRVLLDSAEPWLRKVLLLSGIDALPNVELTGRSS